MDKEYTHTTTLKMTKNDYDILDKFSTETGFTKSHIFRTGMMKFINEVEQKNIIRMLKGE